MTKGTANPRAWGHEMTSTVTIRSTANAGSPRRESQAAKVSTPAAIATTVSQKAARSARACAREREVCACSTSRMMPARAVCSPTPVTLTRSEPAPFTVPANTTLNLTARTYTTLGSPTSCNNTVTDTFISLRDAADVELAFNDDLAGSTYCSQIQSFSVSGGAAGATFYIFVRGYLDSFGGTEAQTAYFMDITLQ